MKLDDIKPVAYLIDYTHQEKPVFLQKEIVYDLRNQSEEGGIVKPLYDAEQMQEYAKAQVDEALQACLQIKIPGRRNGKSAMIAEQFKNTIDSIFEEDTKND